MALNLHWIEKGTEYQPKEGDFISDSGWGLNLGDILHKADQEIPLSQEELIYLLDLSETGEIAKVFEAARKLRQRYFGNKVFLYGFVYFSTFCRNDCAFCLYRKSNQAFTRYRKSEEDILTAADRLVESGVHLLDLTMGEDPGYLSDSGYGMEKLFRTIERVKITTGTPLMISPGVVREDDLQEFRRLGVDWYACYQETHNKLLYSQLRLGQSYEERMDRKVAARKIGMLIEEGLLTGVGDTNSDVANSLGIMRNLQAEQVRVMSFVPQEGTPMSHFSTVSKVRELLIIAVMRLFLPDRLIPASLDVDGLNGLSRRLDAGANVVTSIIPPQSGLAGVSQSSLDIEDGNRTVSAVIPVLERNGLVAACREEYAAWVKEKRSQTVRVRKGAAACG